MRDITVFVLHVKIKMKSGHGPLAEQVFGGPFKAAITAQEGFKFVQFLRPDDGGIYVLAIGFETQPLQQKWVATDLHTKVWSEMERHFDSYTVNTFTAV